MDRCDCDWCVNAGSFKHVTNHPTRYRCEKEKVMECFHHATFKCRHCGEEFSVKDNTREIHSLADRIKELESKLGAALSGISSVGATVGSGRHDATSDHNDTQQAGKAASGPPAAPSVSAVVWRGRAMAYRDDGYKSAADACDLAAAVAAFCEREWSNKGLDQAWDLNRLGEIALAFVRGEPLPQKGE